MRGLPAAAFAMLLCCSSAAFAESVELAVNFELTDLDYKPLSNVPVRVVFGSDPKWQNAGAGNSFVTDAAGEGHFTTRVTIEKVQRKAPSSFLGELLSAPMTMDHISAGAELGYAGHHWLYVEEIYRLPEGDSLLDDWSVYSKDTQGNFTLKAANDENGWKMADLKSLVLSGPGYESWDHMLERGKDEAHWTLKLAFKKSPEPVMR